MIELAAILASLILLGLAVFQIFLIAGTPIGRFAWGGQHQVLPTKLRIASVSSVVSYAVFAVIILNKAGLIYTTDNIRVIDLAMWVLTVYFFIGILMNGISRSRPERFLMTPVATLLALLFLYVALTG